MAEGGAGRIHSLMSRENLLMKEVLNLMRQLYLTIRNVLLVMLLMLLMQSSVLANSILELPGDYPPINVTSSLVVLDETSIAQAAKEKSSIKMYDEWMIKLGYKLSTMSWKQGYWSLSKWRHKSDVQLGIITPYSITRYVYYYADTQFEPVRQTTLEEMRTYANVAYVVIYPEETNIDGVAASIREVKIKVGETEYKSLPKDKFLPKFLFKVNSNIKPEYVWPFPTALINKSLPINIIVIDDDGEVLTKELSDNKIKKLK
jgi:hypothetical protein